ncbi:MAG: YicC family protein [Verrucomicrobia bacterium]|nr:MAG: YicC family protein [Verrucomicrobiota bacterium]
MKSMTGYGRGTASHEGLEAVVQVNSVNRRNLEVTFSMPREWQMLEPELSRIVRDRVARGRVHVVVEVTGGETQGLNWDDAVVADVLRRLERLAVARGVEFVPTPELLLHVAELSGGAAKVDPEVLLAAVKPALGDAMEALIAMRAREGEALQRDLRQRILTLDALVERISERSRHTVPAYRELLMQRLRQAGLELDVEDERVLKEVALFADRADISEELTRLKSHLRQFLDLTDQEGPVGRKAEFILQEVGREFNTIGSKANDLEIARAVIDAKNELERIREQVQNIE